MIKYNYEISVNDNKARLNKDIFLFRGNRNIHYYFSIKGARFTFSKTNEDLIESSNAIYAAVTVIKPNGVEVANAIAPVEDGVIHLKVTEDLIDEEVEVGDFDLVFDLFDDSEGAVTIPKIQGQFHVQERPCTTSIGTLSGNANIVNQAVVDLATATQENEQLVVVDDNGKYVKTVWKTGDKISVERLNKIEEGLEDVSSQYKDVAKKTDIPDVSTKVDKVAGKGLSTNDYTNEDKQKLQNCISGSNIDSAVSAYLEAHPITGGITATAKNLLIAILRNGVYTSDQSSNITNLVGALSASGGDTPSITYYNITNNLTNCTNGNINSTVEENTSYSCAITANSGYELNTVTVTMGGVDITSTAYSNGNIAISKVTGNIVITATATEKQVVAEMPTNGLVDLFDFRNCEYDNSSTTKIKATKGNGGLYGWFNSGVEKQDAKYGIKSSKTYSYSTDYSTNGASANSSFTQVFMSYFSTNTGNNPLFNPTWGKLSNVGALTFTPAYIDTTDASKKLANENIAGSRGGWIRIILSVDATTKICKLYVNDKCVSTHDGNSITDFKNWATNISMKLLNVNTNGDYYMTQFALYNKALSEVEVTEAMAYLKTLEVA